MQYHDYDAFVVPLPGAYKLGRLDGDTTWSISLKNTPNSIQNVDSIGVAGKLILAHSFRTITRDTLESAAWFILAPDWKQERQFEEIGDYRAALRKLQTSDSRWPVRFLNLFLQKGEPINWAAGK